MGVSNFGLGINLIVKGNAEAGFSKIGESFGAFANQLPGGIGNMVKMGAKMGAIALAAIALKKAFQLLKETISEGVKEAHTFEYGMAEVSTLLVGQAEKALPALSNAVRQTAITYGQEMPVMTKAMYQAISAGQQVGTIGTFFDIAGKLAVGGVTDMQTSVDGLTSIVNAYGYNMDETRKAGDQMFIAMREGKTTIGELSGAMGNIAPIAANVGIGLDQILAATSSLTLTGLGTSEAVTGIRQTMLELLKVTPKMAKAAKQYGIDTRQSTIQQMGFVKWLKYARDAVDAHGGKLTDLFRSAESINAVMSLTGKQFETNNRVLVAMAAAAGEADVAFQKIARTGVFLENQAKQTRTDFLIEFGGLFTPIADMWNEFKISFFQTAKSIVQWIREKFVNPAVEAFKPFAQVFKYVGQVVGFILKKYFQGGAWILTKFFQAWLWPIKKVGEGISTLIDWIKQAWDWLGKFSTGLLQKWASPLAWLLKWIKLIGEEIRYRWEQASTFAEMSPALVTREGRRIHKDAQENITTGHEMRKRLIEANEKKQEALFQKGMLRSLRQSENEKKSQGPDKVEIVNDEGNPVPTKSKDATVDYLHDMFFQNFAYGELSR